MLRNVLTFFQSELSAYLQSIGVENPEISFPEPNAGNQESINFVDNALNLLLINLEEENSLRPPDTFQHQKKEQSFSGFPEIRLNLYLLFVANRSDYLTSIDLLSLVIRFFQANHVFNHSNFPALSEEIEKLTLELVTLSFAQQNEVWNMLRTSYKPSVLYKIRMEIFSQPETLQKQPGVV